MFGLQKVFAFWAAAATVLSRSAMVSGQVADDLLIPGCLPKWSGLDFPVASAVAGTQSNIALSTTDDDGFEMLWDSPEDADGSFAIRARSFPRVGGVKPPLAVNSHTINSQRFADIAKLADGDQLAVWASTAEDGDEDGVFYRRISASGELGPAEQANTYTLGSQTNPSVAALKNGGYCIAWHSVGQDPDGSVGIYARCYVPGQSPTPEFRLNTVFMGYQANVKIIVRSDGSLLAVWEGYQDADGSAGISGQYFWPDGTLIGPPLSINQHVAGNQLKAVILALDDLVEVVAYESDQDLDGSYGVYARIFQNQTPADAFALHTETVGNQLNLALAKLFYGFAAAWQSPLDPDGSFRVSYREFNTSGFPYAAERGINSNTTGDQAKPKLAAAGGYVFCGFESYYPDSAGDVLARIIDDGSLQHAAAANSTAPTQWLAGASASPDGRVLLHWQAKLPCDDLAGRFLFPNGTNSSIDKPLQDYDFLDQQFLSSLHAGNNSHLFVWVSPLPEKSGISILAQFRNDSLDATGPAQELVHLVDDQMFSAPALAVQAEAGQYRLLWSDAGNIYSLSFDSSTLAVTAGPVQSNSGIALRQAEPAMAIFSGDIELQVWVSYKLYGPGYDLVARLLNQGRALGQEFPIASSTSSQNHRRPRILLVDENRALLCWESIHPSNGRSDIWLQALSRTGVLLGSPIRANDLLQGAQRFCTLSLLEGSIAVAWQMRLNQDWDVAARFYSLELQPLAPSQVVHANRSGDQQRPFALGNKLFWDGAGDLGEGRIYQSLLSPPSPPLVTASPLPTGSATPVPVPSPVLSLSQLAAQLSYLEDTAVQYPLPQVNTPNTWISLSLSFEQGLGKITTRPSAASNLDIQSGDGFLVLRGDKQSIASLAVYFMPNPGVYRAFQIRGSVIDALDSPVYWTTSMQGQPINHIPELISPNLNQTLVHGTNTSINFNDYFRDPDGDRLRILLRGLPQGLNQQNGTLLGRAEAIGTSSAEVEASDGQLTLLKSFFIKVIYAESGLRLELAQRDFFGSEDERIALTGLVLHSSYGNISVSLTNSDPSTGLIRYEAPTGQQQATSFNLRGSLAEANAFLSKLSFFPAPKSLRASLLLKVMDYLNNSLSQNIGIYLIPKANSPVPTPLASSESNSSAVNQATYITNVDNGKPQRVWPYITVIAVLAFLLLLGGAAAYGHKRHLQTKLKRKEPEESEDIAKIENGPGEAPALAAATLVVEPASSNASPVISGLPPLTSKKKELPPLGPKEPSILTMERSKWFQRKANREPPGAANNRDQQGQSISAHTEALRPV